MNKKKYSKSIFIFHRDLRVDDNIALDASCRLSDVIIPCFIFDENQISSKNKFRSDNAVQFMLDSLVDLNKQIMKRHGKLYIFYGKYEDIIKHLINQCKVDAVFQSRDYTAYSKLRDDRTSMLCEKADVKFEQFAGLLLTEPEAVKKSDKKPYTIFTPFFKMASKLKVDLPKKVSPQNLFYGKIKGEILLQNVAKKILKKRNKNTFVGGRTEGLKILRQINKFENYDRVRDFPALDATTKLSAHHKFGTISIRESYHAISNSMGRHHSLIRQLYWRDFFTHIAFNFPRIFGHAFHEKYDQIRWQNDKAKFKAWCTGTTGFPIIDAGIRQLNATGFMHNRLRMIVASFLVKDLHIDWRLGEKYFATKLVDYDPCVNNGNWQWAASTGCDATPYFRVFNPWIQQKKFDPACEYIKKWVPELATVPVKQIHQYFKQEVPIKAYPLPIVKHEVESKRWIAQVKSTL